MTSLLKKLSLQLERPSNLRDSTPGTPLVSHPSFNDFSFHVQEEISSDVDLKPENSSYKKFCSDAKPSSTEQLYVPASPFGPPVVGSAPAGLAPINAPKTAALAIPSHSPTQYLVESTPKSTTPRRSTDLPATPRSPTSPGSQRRHPKSPKINGMDYYDFCELLRSSSL